MGFSLVAWVVTPLAAIDVLRWVIWVFGILGTVALVVSGVFAFNAVRRDRERALSVIAVLILVLWFLIAVVAILVTGGE